MSERTTWSMPLKGVHLRYMQEQANRLSIGLETEAQSVACTACGSRELVGYGRMLWRIRDLPIDQKSVLLEISRRRLRCKNCQVTFNEPVANIAEAHRTTNRLAQKIWQMGLYYSFNALAPRFGMDEKTLRAIFSDRLAQALAGFNHQHYNQPPRLMVLYRPIIQRQKRLLWVNADLDTLVDLNPLITADRLSQTLHRLGLSAQPAPSQLWVPPETGLIRLLQGQLIDTPNFALRLHPAQVRQESARLLGRNGASTQALQALILADSAAMAAEAIAALSRLDVAENAGLRDFIAALAMLGSEGLKSFDGPSLVCENLLLRLDNHLSRQLAKRSYDALNAMLLFDKNLQVTARTGVARDGTQLGYQKAHYGTSLSRLLAKLDQLPAL